MEIKCQLDATEVFIADLIACSTSFGHHYAHHQELKSIIQYYTHFFLVPRLRMSVAMPLLLLYAFMAWAEKLLPFAVMFEGTLRFV